MTSIVCRVARHPFKAQRRRRLGPMSSETTKNAPNCCAIAVSARHRGTLRTFVGFYPVLSEFRSRLVIGQAERQILDTLLDQLGELGLIRERGRQRTHSTHVLAAVRGLN